MCMKRVTEFIIIFIILLVLAMLVWFWVESDEPNLLVEDIHQEELVMAENENVKVEEPLIGQTISSPLKITGQARGWWFFEADFPVVLVDWDGRIVAQGIAQAQADPATGEVNWMTEDFVPFEAELEFVKPDVSVSNRGSLILKKDNPSGLPENDDALEFEIYFE